MNEKEARKRAQRALLRRIGPSTMPIETGVYREGIFAGRVWAYDPETGARAVWSFVNADRLGLVYWKSSR